MANRTKNELKAAACAAIDAVNPTGDPNVPMSDSDYISAVTGIAGEAENIDGTRKVKGRNKISEFEYVIA